MTVPSGIAIEAEPGVLAGSPGDVLDAVVLAAEADGADPDVWLAKALHHVGATRASVQVRGDPRYRVIEDATHRAGVVFGIMMAHARREIVALLEARRTALPDDPKPPGA